MYVCMYVHKQKVMAKERIQMLEALGFRWDVCLCEYVCIYMMAKERIHRLEALGFR